MEERVPQLLRCCNRSDGFADAVPVPWREKTMLPQQEPCGAADLAAHLHELKSFGTNGLKLFFLRQ